MTEATNRLSDRDTSESLHKKVLVYGSSGTGKTFTVGSLAKEYTLWWLDGENGWETLLQYPTQIQNNIRLFTVPDTSAVPIYSETITKVLTGQACWIDRETGKVNHPLREKNKRPADYICCNEFTGKDILVIDSLTQVVASVMANILRGKPDDYKPDWDDWGNLRVVMTKILTYVQAAKFHIVMISHEEILEQVDKTQKIAPVGGTRNFSRNVGKFFSDVVYMEVKNRKHVAASSTTYSSKVSTKSRTNVALEALPEVSLLELFTQQRN